MPSRRQEKVNELLRQIASRFISQSYCGSGLITVTRSSVSRDLKKATIYVTVLPKGQEEEAIKLLKRSRTDLRREMKSGWHIKTLPFIDFEIDEGEMNRQQIDERLNEERMMNDE